VGGQAFGLDYFNYGNDGSFLNVAAQYSNTDGSTVDATVNPNSASNDLFFLNSIVGSSGALTFYTGNSSIRFNSMTFRSNVGSIQLDRNTMASATASTILMRGGGVTMEAGAGPVTWGRTDQRVALGAEADFTITNDSSSDLTFNREVQSLTNNTTHTITVAGSGSGNTIFHDIRTLSNGRETAMTINTSGSGIVKYAGDMTYLGATTITAGTLQIGDGGTAGKIATGSAITNNGTLVFNRSNAVTQGTDFASVIAGTGNLEQAGSNTLTLSGNNTYTGTTTVSAGTLALGSNQSLGAIAGSGAISLSSYNLTADSASSTTFSGVMSGTGAFTKSGAGTLVLSGANTYTGAITINGGTLSISSVANGGAASNIGQSTNAAANLVLGGGELAYTGSTASTDRNFTLTADTTSTIHVTESGTSLTISGAAASTNGSLAKSGSGTLILSGNNSYSGTTTISAGTLEIGATGRLGGGTYSANIANNGVLVYSGTNAQTLSGEISGTGALTRNGAGTLTLTGNNSYSGVTTVSAGTLTLNNAANNNQTIQGDILIDGGVLSYGTVDNQIADSSNVTITSGTLNLGSRAETINSLIMGGGNLTFGNLTLGASSSFTGGSSVRQTGSSSAQRLTTNGTLTLGDTIFTYSHASTDAGGGLVLNGDLVVNSNTTADFTNAIVGSGRIILNDANRVFDIGSGANMNVAWRIRSVTESLGALTKNGSGTLTLTASNVYSGGTTINDGTLVLGTATDTLANTGAVTINGGTLSIGANSDIVGVVTLAGGDITGTIGVLTGSSYELQSGNVTAILGGTGAATKTTAGTVILSGANTYTGDTTISAGTLEIGASGLLDGGAYAGNISLDGVLIYSGTSNQTLSGVISGSGALTQNSSSTLTLSGANTYTGTISINAGTIEIGAAGRLGAGSYAGNISNNGTLIHSGTNAQTFSGEISGTGSLTQNAASQLLLTGNNSYTGTTTISAGTIRLQNTAANNETIVGDITISGGQLTVAAANQIADTASVTLTSGSIELSIYNETINSLTMSGGDLRRATGTLALNSASSFTGGSLNFASNTGRIITNATSTLGDVTFDFSVASGTSTLGLVLGGDITVNAGTTTNFTNSGGGLGRIDLNGADRVIDVGAAATMNVDWTIAGTSAGITKNGTGSLVLSGSNTYSGATVVNAGILEAANANALGSTTGVTVNGGSLLVSADDAINSLGVTLNKAIVGDASAAQAALAFDGVYSNTSGQAGALTLSQNSIIDLGTGGVEVHFASIANLNSYILHIFNWEGDTVWSGSPGGGKDQFYVDSSLSSSQLDNIRFYSGTTQSSFISTGFQIVGGSFNQEIIAVPEPETYATAILLLVGFGIYARREFLRRRMIS
jgi:fibronectin-binding autotransporter adhesin